MAATLSSRSEHSSYTWKYISCAANHHGKQNVTPVMNCIGRARCHCAWRQVTPPSRLLLAAGHSISVVVCVRQSSPATLSAPLPPRCHLLRPRRLSSCDSPTALVSTCDCEQFLWMSKSNLGGLSLGKFCTFFHAAGPAVTLCSGCLFNALNINCI